MSQPKKTSKKKPSIPTTALEIALLRLQTETAPSLLSLALAEAEQGIKNYCNMTENEEIPQALYFVWAEMAVILVQNWSGEATVAVTGALTDVRMGDTSYGFAAGGKTPQEFLGEVLGNYARLLDKFRRLKWA